VDRSVEDGGTWRSRLVPGPLESRLHARHQERSSQARPRLPVVRPRRPRPRLRPQLRRPPDRRDPGRAHQGGPEGHRRPARISVRHGLRRLLRGLRDPARPPRGRLGPAAPDRVGHGVLEPHDRALGPRARLRTACARAPRRRRGRGERGARRLLSSLGLVSTGETGRRARHLLERHLHRRRPGPRNRRPHRGPLGRGFPRRHRAPRPPRLAGRVPRRGSSGPRPRSLGAHAPRASARGLRGFAPRDPGPSRTNRVPSGSSSARCPP
jgi:hypothetical protein